MKKKRDAPRCGAWVEAPKGGVTTICGRKADEVLPDLGGKHEPVFPLCLSHLEQLAENLSDMCWVSKRYVEWTWTPLMLKRGLAVYLEPTP